ncbi:transmembrane protein 160 isoform X2 [Tachysurus fulvidraco]|uniref:transmembrane protein 160 isoform X2 n=1 Tax=Tachysurus fulvidraco TaxID=1234273 RepID=UPI000F4E668C|nr:transmembrane protein 160 isoform X2 [Tachysurus fulvidraco]
MASLSWWLCGRLYRSVSPLCSRMMTVTGPRCMMSPGRRIHRAPSRWMTEKGVWGKTQQQVTELDKADALILRKSHETGFLSWFRNGLLATGIGVIAFVQSDVGREAGYAFFILGGVCVSFGGGSYIASLLSLRRIMLLSLPSVLLHTAVVSSSALFWLCAVSLYIGRLEVEIIHDEDEEEEGGNDGGDCAECKARRDRRHMNERGQEK